MKKMTTLLLILLLAAACSESGEAVTDNVADTDVSICDCVNEPIKTGARARSCSSLLATMSPEESATQTMACREQLAVPSDGPDLCFCMRSTSTDPEIMQACEALMPENFGPAQMTALNVKCARNGG